MDVSKLPKPWQQRMDEQGKRECMTLAVELMQEEIAEYQKLAIEMYESQFKPKFMVCESYFHRLPQLVEDDSRGCFGPFSSIEEAEAWMREEHPKTWHMMWVQTLHPVKEKSILDYEE